MVDFSGFYTKSVEERQRLTGKAASLSDDDMHTMDYFGSLNPKIANAMIENVITVAELPFAVVPNFVINAEEVLVPYAIEEPSVVAGAAGMAKKMAKTGGIKVNVTDSLMMGTVYLRDVHKDYAAPLILERMDEIIKKANTPPKPSTIISNGGGTKHLRVRSVKTETKGWMTAVDFYIDTLGAQGANFVNGTVERVAPDLEELTGCKRVMSILTNLCDSRMVEATGKVEVSDLGDENFSGEYVLETLECASEIAEADPYRAATHNKGALNGIDAVALAFGQDWRAIEAGAHAYAARGGRYTSLSTWRREGDCITGKLRMPLAVGKVGGAVDVLPKAQLAMKIAKVDSVKKLAAIHAAAGLANNLAAMRSLVTEGIQHHHMPFHSRKAA